MFVHFGAYMEMEGKSNEDSPPRLSSLHAYLVGDQLKSHGAKSLTAI